MSKLFLAVCLSLFGLFCGSAHAYEYNYVSKVFQVEFNSFGGPNGPISVLQDGVLTVRIETPTLLTAGSTWAPGMSYQMSRVANGITGQSLEYPDTTADPHYAPGTVWNPNLTAIMMIEAVGADGLPTAWNISLQRELTTPTGREDLSDLFSSNTGDRVFGLYVGFHGFHGASDGPGTWTMAATAVPEPESYAMLMAGLSLIGAAAHRRSLRRRRATWADTLS